MGRGSPPQGNGALYPYAIPGESPPGAAMLIASTDGYVVTTIRTSANGELIVAGVDAAGNLHTIPVGVAAQSAPSRGMSIGGTDGTDMRLLLTDAEGRLKVASISGVVTTTNNPVLIANLTAGTTVAAAGTLLTTAYTAPDAGTLNVTYALETATPVQVSFDDGTFYANYADGSAAVASAVYSYSVGVPSGAVVQFAVPTATTIGIFAAWFQATQ